MSVSESTEMNALIDNLNKKIRDLENENKELKIENEILIDRNEYLLDKNEYLLEINKKNEYLEFKIKDFVDLEIENEAWRNGYDELIKQYDSDFSLKYLKNMNEELKDKIKLFEIEMETLASANIDVVKQNKILEYKIQDLLSPKEPLKPAHIKEKDTKNDNKMSVFVKPFIRDGVKYYKSADNILYDKFGYPQGKWDAAAAKMVVLISEEDAKNGALRREKLHFLL